MKRAEMRVVGLSNSLGKVWVQRGNKFGWEQEIVFLNDFTTMVENEFPEHVNEYRKSSSDKAIADWFYEYGEDGKETYIFK